MPVDGGAGGIRLQGGNLLSVADPIAAQLPSALLGLGALFCLAGACLALAKRRRDAAREGVQIGPARATCPHPAALRTRPRTRPPARAGRIPSPDRCRAPEGPVSFEAAVLLKPGVRPGRKGRGRKGRDGETKPPRRNRPGEGP